MRTGTLGEGMNPSRPNVSEKMAVAGVSTLKALVRDVIGLSGVGYSPPAMDEKRPSPSLCLTSSTPRMRSWIELRGAGYVVLFSANTRNDHPRRMEVVSTWRQPRHGDHGGVMRRGRIMGGNRIYSLGR